MRSRHNPRCWIPLVLMCVTSVTAQPGVPVRLNEFLASNSTVLADAEGQYDDWIELYNAGPSPVDVGGMFLTDDSGEPTRWQIPRDRPDLTVVPAGGYVLIWADGDTDSAGLHANFKLSGDGEEIALFDSNGATLIDRVVFGPQRGNISLGRYPDGASDWAFMTTPTPGQANAQAFVGIVEDVTFSVEHGFFTEPVTVTLTTDTADAQIWYTLDSTTPRRNADGQFEATRYDQAIPIDGTTVIRAVAVKPGWKDSDRTSSTYLFAAGIQKQLYSPPEPDPPPDTQRRGGDVDPPDIPEEPIDEPADPALEAALQALPSVCLVIEPNDFFDSQTGINANPLGRGIAWERPVSVEWFDPNDSLSFQVNAGVRIHGGISRSAFGRSSGPAKHSLRLLFKPEYGPLRLNAPLLADSDVTEFDTLVLRCTFSDSWAGSALAQYLRDQFSRDTMRDMGRLTPYGRPVHVYINELYWGLYILVERPDDGFAAAHLGGSKDEYDALKARSVSDSDQSPMEVVAGDLEAWNALFDLAAAGLEEQASYDLVREYVDVPSLIDYMLMIFYIGSTDGPLGLGDGTPRNFWAIRPRAAAGGFVFLAWDLEFSLDDLDTNRVTAIGTDNPHYLFHRLAAHADFRMLVADRICRNFFFDGPLTPERVIERYRLRAADVERAMLAEAVRWGDSTESWIVDSTLSRWRRERDRLIQTYFPARGGIVVEQLRTAGFYPAIEPAQFEIDGTPQHGGTTYTGAPLALVNPNAGGTLYYTTDGIDPRMFGLVADANELITLVDAHAEKRVFIPTEDIGDDWKGGHEPYDDTSWTAGMPALADAGGAVGYRRGRRLDPRISYNVADAMAGRTSCYIRIPFHVSAEGLTALSHLALRVQCDDGFVAYLNGFEVGSINKPDPLTWNASCANRPESDESAWLALPAARNLLHPGENILAIHALENSRDDIFLFSVELCGSDRAFAAGHVVSSAQLYSEPIALTESRQIKARIWHDGAWSPLTEAVFAVGAVRENLRLTEIMYHPPEPNEEFVELANTGMETINVNEVRLAGGIDFVFPSLELAPGATTLIVRDIEAFRDRYGPEPSVAGRYEGALSNAGERLELLDALGRTIQEIRYDDRWYDQTDGQGYSLVCRDPFAQDPNTWSDRESWQPSLLIGGSPGLFANSETLRTD